MGVGFAAVLFGLASAITWGGGDFCGGLAARRAPVLAVLLISGGGGLVLIIALALLFAEAAPTQTTLLWGAAAGAAGTLGLGMLYRGLSVGRASVVAPTSAVLSAVLPAVWSIFSEGLPGGLRLVGFALALVGIWLVARAPSEGGGASGIGLALLAGVGFGVFFILIHQAGSGGTFWPLAAARAMTFTLTMLALLVQRQALQFNRGTLQIAMLAGALDVGGNTFFVLAGQAGRLDVAAVLSSLYPASTVLLSRIVLHERIAPLQAIGVAVALVAVALIAV